jgi:hypothetical protein
MDYCRYYFTCRLRKFYTNKRLQFIAREELSNFAYAWHLLRMKDLYRATCAET